MEGLIILASLFTIGALPPIIDWWNNVPLYPKDIESAEQWISSSDYDTPKHFNNSYDIGFPNRPL